MDEVILQIEGQEFKVSKELLMQYSDYFRAMFSGNFVENERKHIAIDLVDAHSMSIIIKYMNIGLIELSEYTLPEIANLGVAAIFLQITELFKQIEYCLDLQLTNSNWLETMAVAEQLTFSKLQHLSAAHGLLNFKRMKQEDIPTIDKLFWYLSHPYLDADTELDVFTFGFEWITHMETGADALLIIIGCLDVTRLSVTEVDKILLMMKEYEMTLAEKVLQCIKSLIPDKITLENVISNKESLCVRFTERVYNETLNIVRENKKRKLVFTPVIPMWTRVPTTEPHHMYTFTTNSGFDKWLEVGDKSLWGWNVTSWGATKLVVACGEFGRGMGVFMRDVKIYDTLRKEWIVHGAQLPCRRHGGVAILDDTLYIIGGVGSYRVIQDSAIVYDLKQRTHREIAKFPEALQSPAVCCHKGAIYASADKVIYKYEELKKTDRWTAVLTSNIKLGDMTSFREHMYCSQKFFSHIYMFRPGIDKKFTKIDTVFPTITMCSLNDRLLLFNGPIKSEPPQLIIMEHKGWDTKESVFSKPVWKVDNIHLKVNDGAGTTALVLDMPCLKTELSKYHQKYISRYMNLVYGKEKIG